MSTVEGYDLHVYCDDPEHQERILRAGQAVWQRFEGPGQYSGHSARDCYRQAKAAGWTIRRRLPGIPEAVNGGKQARCWYCTQQRAQRK